MMTAIPVKVSDKAWVNPLDIVAVLLDDNLKTVVMIRNGISIKSDFMFAKVYDNWVRALSGEEPSTVDLI